MNNYKYWLNNAPKYVVDVISKWNKDKIEKYFSDEIHFGTAGIRGVIEYGTNSINEFVIARTAKAYGLFIKKHHGLGKIILGRDNRQRGEEFIKIIAGTLGAIGFEVLLFPENRIMPAGVISYTCITQKAKGAINLSASHNPKEYTGMKPYNHKGGHMEVIETKEIEDILSSLDYFDIDTSGDYKYLSEEVIEEYIEDVIKKTPIIENNFNEVKITYTPLHGTSYEFFTKIASRLNINLDIVESQKLPLPGFDNIVSPNPQDWETFDIAIKQAEKRGSDIVIGTDPDADRFGIVIKHKNNWKFITGNQIAAIQLEYILEATKNMNNRVVIKSMVTSDLGKKICKKNNVSILETLTGFKNLISLADKEEEKGNNVVIVYEESYGARIAPINRDKDAMQSFIIISQLASMLKKKNKTLIDYLNNIFSKYGIYYDGLFSLKINGINWKEKAINYIDKISNTSFMKKFNLNISKIEKIEEQNLTKIILSDGWIALRPSGTEPLLRIYYDINSKKKLIDIKKLIHELD